MTEGLEYHGREGLEYHGREGLEYAASGLLGMEGKRASPN